MCVSFALTCLSVKATIPFVLRKAHVVAVIGMACCVSFNENGHVGLTTGSFNGAMSFVGDLADASRATNEKRLVDVQGSTTCEFFGVPFGDLGASNLVFVVDGSAFMRSELNRNFSEYRIRNRDSDITPITWEVVKHEFAEAMACARTPPQDVVVFGSRVLRWRNTLGELGALSNAKTMQPSSTPESPSVDAASWMGQIRPDGDGTGIVEAVQIALLESPRRIIIVTNGPRLWHTDTLLAKVRDASLAGVRFDTVAIGPNQNSMLLFKIASLGHGAFQSM